MRPGDIIADRYILHRKIGEGGMGTVWHATHTKTERALALKLLHPNVANTEDARKRFMREARASARINHPNVVDVLDAGESDDGVLFLAMEMLDGISLSKALRADPLMSLRDFLVVMADVCRALAAAHATGIVHRDVKPGNIFIHRERGASFAHGKVLDFGISKFLDDTLDGPTTTGAMVGSPRYMSPEQVKGESAVDHRADMWALGVLLFRAISGTWPHPGAENFTALCVKIGTQAPVDIDAVAPEAPARLRAIVDHCLQPIDTRLADAGAMADDLEAVAADPRVVSLTVAPRLKGPTSLIPSDSYRVRTPTSRDMADGIDTPIPGSLSHGAVSRAEFPTVQTSPRRVGLWVVAAVVVLGVSAVVAVQVQPTTVGAALATPTVPTVTASTSPPSVAPSASVVEVMPSASARAEATASAVPSHSALPEPAPRARRRVAPPTAKSAPAPVKKTGVPGENLGSGL